MTAKDCFCINPSCSKPDHYGNNQPQTNFCLSCGSKLLLNGKYRTGKLLSDSSGFGNVYEVFAGFSPKILKVLKPEHNTSQKAIELFKQEYDILNELSNNQQVSGIPKVEDYFIYYNKQYLPLYCFVMEKVEGINLEQWLEQYEKLKDQKLAIKWLTQIVTILDQIHKFNWFHRDIKPANIMLKNNGELVLIDFGTAREETQTYYQNLQGQRVTGIISVGYTPIEQQNGQAVNQSDLFALGRTFVHLLTGKHPLDTSIYDGMNDQLNWREKTEYIGDELLDLIDDMSQRLCKDRPKNTEEILQRLNQISMDYKPSSSNLVSGQNLGNAIASPSVQNKPLNFTLVHTLKGHGYWKNQTTLLGLVTVGTNFVYSVVYCVNFSPDSRMLASGGADKNIRIWDVVTGEQKDIFYGHSSSIKTLDFSPNGHLLAGGRFSGSIKILDVSTGKQLPTLISHSSTVNSVNFSPDGKYLASGSDDKTIKIWDVKTGQELFNLKGGLHWVNSVNFSPDGRFLASGSCDNTIKIWDANTGEQLQTLNGHSLWINSVNFSPDGKYLASGSSNKTIKIWDVNTGQELRTLTGHSDGINTVNFSPDGKYLASGSEDKTIKIWDVNTGQELRTLTDHSGSIFSVNFSPDGKYLASGSEDKTIKIWRIK